MSAACGFEPQRLCALLTLVPALTVAVRPAISHT